MCRFINADSVISGTGESVRGYNMFAYCFNNPINLDDANGNWPKWVEKAISAVKSATVKIKNYVKKAVAPVVNKVKEHMVVRHNVPLYNQGNRPLCWAYSQTMVEDFNSGTTRTQVEADARAREIAISVHGEKNWNQGGWPTNAGMNHTPKSITELYFMVRKEPVYGYYSGNNSGHLVVITGVDVSKNEVYTNNPWGLSGVQTFDEFKAGFFGGDDSMSLQYCVFVD